MDKLHNYVVVDLETTGLNPKTDKIIEIGAVRVRNDQPQEEFSTFVNPGRGLPLRIQEITHILQEQVDKAPMQNEILESFIEFLGDDVLLGHQILFDYSFLKRAAVNQKLSFEKEGIDTLRIARRFLCDLPSKRLGDLCQYYQIEIEAHRALQDARATHMLYQKLRETFYEQEADLFLPRKLFYQVKKDSPITPKQKEQIARLVKVYQLPMQEGHLLPPIPDITQEWIDVNTMTKSEASRLVDYMRTRLTAPASDCE